MLLAIPMALCLLSQANCGGDPASGYLKVHKKMLVDLRAYNEKMKNDPKFLKDADQATTKNIGYMMHNANEVLNFIESPSRFLNNPENAKILTGLNLYTKVLPDFCWVRDIYRYRVIEPYIKNTWDPGNPCYYDYNRKWFTRNHPQMIIQTADGPMGEQFPELSKKYFEGSDKILKDALLKFRELEKKVEVTKGYTGILL
jgi:hypothetical protein